MMTSSRHGAGADFSLNYNNQTKFFRIRRVEGRLRYWPRFAPRLADQVNTGSFSYLQFPAEIEVSIPFERWELGAGVDNQSGASKTASSGALPLPAYSYSQGVDASYEDRLYISPSSNAMTGPTSAPIKFAELADGVFCIAGTSIWEIAAADSAPVWTERNDASGDAVNYTDIAEMDGINYAGRGDSVDYKYSADGITWTAFTDADRNQKFFAVRGISSAEAVLWGVTETGLVRNTTNGQNGGVAWSANDAVAHTSETVKGVVVANDDIYIFTDRAIYLYTGSATKDLWTGGRALNAAQNGHSPLSWVDGRVYVPYGERLLAFAPTDDQTAAIDIEQVFPLAGLSHPEVNGEITATAASATHIYIAVKNAAGNTYIMKGRPGTGWHTWMYLGANDCNAMLVASPGVVHPTNPVLLFGYGASARFAVLPRAHLLPDQDSQYRFDTAGGTLYGSYVDTGALAFAKLLNRGSLETESTTAARTVALAYRVDNGSATTLLTATDDGRNDANVSTEVSFRRVRAEITLSTNNVEASPIVLGALFGVTQTPPNKRMWQIETDIRDQISMPDGTQSPDSLKELRKFLFNARHARATFQDFRENGDDFTVIVLDVVPPVDGMLENEEYYTLVMAEIGRTLDTVNVGRYNFGHFYNTEKVYKAG